MKIVVCVKHVPSDQSERRIEDGRVVRGEEDALNELDEHAIEAAVTLAENTGETGTETQVIAVTMGPQSATAAVRRALQVGADRGLVITDERIAGSDVNATARILAAAVRYLGAQEPAGPVDLIVTGASSTDGLTSLLPAALSAVLGIPALTSAVAVEVREGALQVDRLTPQSSDTLRAPLPALVSVTDQANTPRHPNMKAMLAAKKKPVDTVGLDELGLGEAAEAGAEGGASASISVLSARQVPARTQGAVIQDTGDGGRKLAAYLREHDLLPDSLS